MKGDMKEKGNCMEEKNPEKGVKIASPLEIKKESTPKVREKQNNGVLEGGKR